MALRTLPLLWGLALTLGVTLGAMPALAQQPSPPPPPREPILRIDPGMHTASIRRIGVDAACTLLATGSYDKTVRLWRLPQGKLLRTLRLPIGPGNDGKVYAVALAPDGSWVAAGGWDTAHEERGGHFVYVFDAATGAIVTRLGPLGDVIYHLAVSPDGQFIAATLGGGQGARVWKKAGTSPGAWRPVASDKAYGGQTPTVRPSIARVGSIRWPMTVSCAAMHRAFRASPARLRPEGASGPAPSRCIPRVTRSP